jgi:hypothetical protein
LEFVDSIRPADFSRSMRRGTSSSTRADNRQVVGADRGQDRRDSAGGVLPSHGRHESNPIRGNCSWTGFIRTANGPEPPVILLEDAAALLGLVFALFGVGFILDTGNGLRDASGTTLIGALLVVFAIVLVIEMKSLLVGKAARIDQQRVIKAAFEGGTNSSAQRVIHL